MSYYLTDIDGYKGDLATNSGLWALSTFIRNEVDNQECKDFMEFGFTEEMDEVVKVLSKIHSNDKYIEKTLRELVVTLKKCKFVAVISNGEELE